MTSLNTILLVLALSLSLRRLREVRKSLATLELGILDDAYMTGLASPPPRSYNSCSTYQHQRLS